MGKLEKEGRAERKWESVHVSKSSEVSKGRDISLMEDDGFVVVGGPVRVCEVLHEVLDGVVRDVTTHNDCPVGSQWSLNWPLEFV